MFTDMISNIFGRKTKSTQPTARKRSRRIPDGDVHGCQNGSPHHQGEWRGVHCRHWQETQRHVTTHSFASDGDA